MNAMKWNRALYMLLGIAALTSMIKWFVGDQQFTFKFVMDCIGTSSTVITVISCVFCQTAWKWEIFRNWLIVVPDLSGGWEGVLESDWIDPDTNKKIAPILLDTYAKREHALFDPIRQDLRPNGNSMFPQCLKCLVNR